MNQFQRLSATDRADFAAYLDGELSDEQTRRIESVLADNAVARKDLEMLSQTYDLLDALPKVQAPPDFAAETVRTAKLEEVRPDITQTEWYRRGVEVVRLCGWSLAMIAAACLGYTITNRWIPAPHDPLVDEFPLIQNLDVYQEIHDYSFLERLSGSTTLMERIRSETAK